MKVLEHLGEALEATCVLLFGADWRVGVFTGFLVALSSTAVVLGLLSQRAETDTPSGRLSLGILIFQDLAIVAMVLVVPLLGGETSSASDVLLVLGKAILLVVGILFLARRAVPWMLEWIARTRRQELFGRSDLLRHRMDYELGRREPRSRCLSRRPRGE